MIVSDYRMPGMKGAQLLERVRLDYPATARVILSDQTNQDSVLSVMLLGHDFLTKPSSPEQLVTTVERLIDVRAPDGTGRRPDRADVQSLPSPPHTLAELIAALDCDDVSVGSVGSVIEQDPAAAAKVLQLVNSSAYSVGRKISNVGQAVSLLGLPTVRGLVLVHDLIRTFDVAGDMPGRIACCASGRRRPRCGSGIPPRRVPAAAARPSLSAPRRPGRRDARSTATARDGRGRGWRTPSLRTG